MPSAVWSVRAREEQRRIRGRIILGAGVLALGLVLLYYVMVWHFIVVAPEWGSEVPVFVVGLTAAVFGVVLMVAPLAMDGGESPGHRSAEPSWPSSTDVRRLVLESLAALFVVFAVATAAVFVWYPSTQQPQVTLVSARHDSTGCQEMVPGFYRESWFWQLNFANTGNANGIATVMFFIDDNTIAQTQYFVPPGETPFYTKWIDGPVQTTLPCHIGVPRAVLAGVVKG